MTLRDRSKKVDGMSPSSSGSAQSLSAVGPSKGGRQSAVATRTTTEDDEVDHKPVPSGEVSEEAPAAKKLPRVLLRVKEPLEPEQPSRLEM